MKDKGDEKSADKLFLYYNLQRITNENSRRWGRHPVA